MTKGGRVFGLRQRCLVSLLFAASAMILGLDPVGLERWRVAIRNLRNRGPCPSRQLPR